MVMEPNADQRAKAKPRGRPFAKGNPGRPHGARNRKTVFLEEMLDGDGEAIVGKVIELARQGDRVALRMAFERLMGSRRERVVPDLRLPQIQSVADCAEAAAAAVAAVGAGEITPNEGLALMQMVDAAGRAFEATERMRALEDRIAALECAAGRAQLRDGGVGRNAGKEGHP